MRLIDADELIINLYHNKKVVLNDDLVKCIDDTETAYEIDKVVAEDECEWKQTSTAKYKTGCGYKVEEYFDTKACYCKQCGKRIKVVEQIITVEELIAKLEKVKDKDKPVFFSTWDEDPDYVDVYEYSKIVQIEQKEYD